MRMWEIRENSENYPGYRMGYRKKSSEEMYDCGYEDGYKAAMEELGENTNYRGYAPRRSR